MHCKTKIIQAPIPIPGPEIIAKICKEMAKRGKVCKNALGYVAKTTWKKHLKDR